MGNDFCAYFKEIVLENKYEKNSSMCGIVGYIGQNDALPVLVGGIKKLEYCGYDSSSVALIDGDKIETVRALGKSVLLKMLLESILFRDVSVLCIPVGQRTEHRLWRKLTRTRVSEVILVSLDIYILVFDCAPKPLDIDVVQRASLAVHRQFRRAGLVLEEAGKLLRSVLATLIGVEHFRSSIKFYGFFQNFHAKVRRQRVG